MGRAAWQTMKLIETRNMKHENYTYRAVREAISWPMLVLVHEATHPTV